jgi:glutaredoxin-like protein
MANCPFPLTIEFVRYFTDEEARALSGRLSRLPHPVRLMFFAQALDCETCDITRRLLADLSEMSPHLTVDERNPVLERDDAVTFGVENVPAIAVVATEDYGVRFYGAPEGHELTSLIDAIEAVSAADSGLSPATRARVAELTEPIELRVFSTPNCPHCPKAVSLAIRLAIESAQIRASAISAIEFPDLVRQYRVTGVPKTVVNGGGAILGALPETAFVEQVMKAAS